MRMHCADTPCGHAVQGTSRTWQTDQSRIHQPALVQACDCVIGWLLRVVIVAPVPCSARQVWDGCCSTSQSLNADLKSSSSSKVGWWLRHTKEQGTPCPTWPGWRSDSTHQSGQSIRWAWSASGVVPRSHAARLLWSSGSITGTSQLVCCRVLWPLMWSWVVEIWCLDAFCITESLS